MKAPPASLWQWLAIALLALAGLAAYSSLAEKLDEVADRAEVAAMIEAAQAEHPPVAEPADEGWRLPADWRCTGRIHGETLGPMIQENMPGVLRCFEGFQGGGGQTTARIRVDAAGHLSALVLDGPVGEDPTVMGCAEQAFGAWPFPTPVGGECAVMTLPLMWSGPTAGAPPSPVRVDAAVSSGP